jgi:hypothetical protein
MNSYLRQRTYDFVKNNCSIFKDKYGNTHILYAVKHKEMSIDKKKYNLSKMIYMYRKNLNELENYKSSYVLFKTCKISDCVYHYMLWLDKVESEFIKKNLKLLNKSQYKTAKSKLDHLCLSHNKICKISYNELKNGHNACKLCTDEKRINTCQEKFGTNHSSQSEEIKEKVRQTNIKNRGVPYPMQSEEVKEKSRQTCTKNYGVSHPMKSKEHKEKVEQTMERKYGVKNSMQLKETREKAKKTWMKKYNVDNPFKATVIKERIKQTLIKKYNVDNPMKCKEIRQKAMKTLMDRIGVDHPMKSKEIQQKMRNKFKAKHGVDHPMKVKEIMEKCFRNALFYKDYEFPSGYIQKVQGYEPFCLNDLLYEHNINEKEIIDGYKNMPTFPYIFDHEKHDYYPDIYIPSLNLIIEVKSNYTITINYDLILAKINACKNAGYNAEIWVYNKEEELVDVI